MNRILLLAAPFGLLCSLGCAHAPCDVDSSGPPLGRLPYDYAKRVADEKLREGMNLCEIRSLLGTHCSDRGQEDGRTWVYTTLREPLPGWNTPSGHMLYLTLDEDLQLTNWSWASE